MNEHVIEKEYLEVDILHMLRALLKRAWILLLAVVVFGAAMFWYSSFIIPPRYEAKAMLYVNNSSISVGSAQFSISSQELSAAKSLVNTYVVILKSRNVLQDVIDETKVPYSYETLKNMISAQAVESTEVFEVCVQSTDPAEAKLIADSICRLLPEKVEDVVDGSSVRIVDHAVTPAVKSSPSVTKYTAVGMAIGFFVSALFVILLELFDQYIRSEEYLLQTYPDIPVLGVIPDLDSSAHHHDRYYSNHYYTSRREGE